MTAGDLITVPGQIELNGLLLGTGTPFIVKSFDPWTSPTFRSEELSTEGRDGATSGDELLGVRPVGAELYIQDPDIVVEEQRSLIAAAFAPSNVDVPIVWEDDWGRWCMFGRPRGASTKNEPAAPTSARFMAMDPLIYAANEESRILTLAPPTGGLTFPLEFPLMFSSGGTSNVIPVLNDGTRPVPWRATFVGPWTNPMVELVDTGERVRLIGEVPVGETLVIDSKGPTIVLGTAARLGWIHTSTRWFRIPVGDSGVRVTGSSGSGQATLAWRPGQL